MPPAQNQRAQTPAIQRRPVRDRKIKQKGYEFEVLSKIQSSIPEDAATSPKTTSVVRRKSLPLVAPTPKRKRRHALFLGQTPRSGSLYAFTPGNKRKRDRPPRLPTTDPASVTSAPNHDPAQTSGLAQTIKKRPGRPRKARPFPGYDLYLEDSEPAAPMEPEKAERSSRHLRAQQRAKQRSEREAIEEDGPVEPVQETESGVDRQMRSRRKITNLRGEVKEDDLPSDHPTNPYISDKDFLERRNSKRQRVDCVSVPVTKATTSSPDEPVSKNKDMQPSFDGKTVQGRIAPPQELSIFEHDSPFISALQRRPHLVRFLSHDRTSSSSLSTNAIWPKSNGICHIKGNSNPYHSGEEQSHQPELNAEDLLPDPMLRHVVWISQDDAWNQSREQQLRLSFGHWASMAASAGSGNDAELWMWRLMIHLFKAMPHELWRYGLRPHHEDCWATDAGLGSKTSKHSYNLSYEFCLELSILLCHPVWEQDLMKLRLALQTAVCSRLEDHEPPVAGLDSRTVTSTKLITDALADTRRNMAPEKELELMCNIQSQYYHCSGLKSDKDIQWLIAKLSTTHKEVSFPAPTDEERLLFMLRTSDMRALREALDAQKSHGQTKWRPAVEYCRIFAETPAGTALTGRSLPSSERTIAIPANHVVLTGWKRECIIAEKRERLIREETACSGAMLFDIPRGDPQPYHVFSREFSKAQQQIVTGVVRLPGT